jgi:hypothetical protein
MPLTRLEKLLPWTGAIAGACWIGHSALQSVTETDKPGSATSQVIRDHLLLNYASVGCLVLMGIVLLFFATAVRNLLRSTEPAEATWSSIAHGGWVVTAAGLSQMVTWNWGAPEGIRTPNLLIRSQMLYPLSYGRDRCASSRSDSGNAQGRSCDRKRLLHRPRGARQRDGTGRHRHGRHRGHGGPRRHGRGRLRRHGHCLHRFHPLHGLVDAGCRVERPLHRRGVGPGLGPRLGPGLRFRLGGRPRGDVLGLVSRCAGRSGFGHGVLLGRGKRSHDPEVRGRPCAATVHSPRAGHEATRRPGDGAQAMRPRATWEGHSRHGAPAMRRHARPRHTLTGSAQPTHGWCRADGS